MIANLVSNAVKYSVAGGTVDLSLESSAEGVVFVCTDNGLGISEKDRQYLFTEFFRSTNLEALQRPGTGLGLARRGWSAKITQIPRAPARCCPGSAAVCDLLPHRTLTVVGLSPHH